LRMRWDGEGLYWFQIRIAGKMFAKTPLRVALKD
jgi:hypothetical protein